MKPNLLLMLTASAVIGTSSLSAVELPTPMKVAGQHQGGAGMSSGTIVVPNAFSPMSPGAQAPPGSYIIQPFFSPGNPTNSPAYPSWSTNDVQDILTKGSPSNAIGFRLLPQYVTLLPDGSGNPMWLSWMIQATGTNVLSLAMTQGIITSSDISAANPNGSLASTYSIPANAIYDGRASGVTFGPTGTVLIRDGQPASTQVRAIIFVGMQCPYYNGYTTDQVQTYFNTFTNFMVRGTVQVTDGTRILASASKTVQAIGSPVQPFIILTKGNPSFLSLNYGFNPPDTGNSYIILMNTAPNPGTNGWVQFGEMMAGDHFPVVSSTQQAAFFKTKLQ